MDLRAIYDDIMTFLRDFMAKLQLFLDGWKNKDYPDNWDF